MFLWVTQQHVNEAERMKRFLKGLYFPHYKLEQAELLLGFETEVKATAVWTDFSWSSAPAGSDIQSQWVHGEKSNGSIFLFNSGFKADFPPELN